MKYKLSKIVPVHFTTVYRKGDENGQPVFAKWWQWRGRIWGHTALEF